MLSQRSYQYRLDEAEIQVVRHVRKLVKRGDVALISPSHVDRLNDEIQLRVFVGNKYLRKYKVNAKETIQSFANVGCEVQAKVLGWPDIDDEDQSNRDDEDEVHSVGTQTVFGDTSEHNDISGNIKDSEPDSWTSTKEKLIPTYVKRVTFTVNEEDMTPIRYTELKHQFPDVLIQPISPSVDLKDTSSEVEKPDGVKTTTLLLDQAEIDKDPGLANKHSNPFPGVTLQEANKRAPQPIEKDTSPTQLVPPHLPLPESLPQEGYVPRPDKDIIELAMSDQMNHLRNLATFEIEVFSAPTLERVEPNQPESGERSAKRDIV
ncbi:hypothetical protein K505DRAFT_413443, partial [Melanomma pulvis-pyrius CBS 109.77]